jgi:hypothetical protein
LLLIVAHLPPFPRIDKKLYTAETINRWAVVIFESERFLRMEQAQSMVTDFVKGCESVGEFYLLRVYDLFLCVCFFARLSTSLHIYDLA